MGLILPSLYKTIADTVDSIQVKTVNISDNLTTVLNDLYASEVDKTDKDKLWLYNGILQDQKLINQNQADTNNRLLDFVRALQDHVTKQYGDVNNYLSNNNIRVYQTFADVSEIVGYPILSNNIVT